MKNYSHYYKLVKHLTHIDVYRVLDLFKVERASVAHAVKKLLCAGNRGAKNYVQDITEARDSLNRELEMLDEDAGHDVTVNINKFSDALGECQLAMVSSGVANFAGFPHPEVSDCGKAEVASMSTICADLADPPMQPHPFAHNDYNHCREALFKWQEFTGLVAAAVLNGISGATSAWKGTAGSLKAKDEAAAAILSKVFKSDYDRCLQMWLDTRTDLINEEYRAHLESLEPTNFAGLGKANTICADLADPSPLLPQPHPFNLEPDEDRRGALFQWERFSAYKPPIVVLEALERARVAWCSCMATLQFKDESAANILRKELDVDYDKCLPLWLSTRRSLISAEFRAYMDSLPQPTPPALPKPVIASEDPRIAFKLEAGVFYRKALLAAGWTDELIAKHCINVVDVKHPGQPKLPQLPPVTAFTVYSEVSQSQQMVALNGRVIKMIPHAMLTQLKHFDIFNYLFGSLKLYHHVGSTPKFLDEAFRQHFGITNKSFQVFEDFLEITQHAKFDFSLFDGNCNLIPK